METVNKIVGRGLQKDYPNKVQVRSHPDVTSRDIIDHIRPEAGKKPNNIVILVGTNDLTATNINTIENFKETSKTMKELSPQTSVAVVFENILKTTCRS